MTQAVKRHKLLLMSALALVLTLVVGFSWLSAGAQEDPGQGTALVPDTDSVDFNASLRAGDKPVEVTGQYAYTYVNGHELISGYATQAQPRQTGSWTEVDDPQDHENGEVSYGEGCVYGGDPGTASCAEPGDAASASTADGYVDELMYRADLLGIPLGILLPPNMEAAMTEPLATMARCSLDEEGNPQLRGERPTGTVTAGTRVLLILDNAESYDISALTDVSGETVPLEKFNFALLGPSYIDLEITPIWGEDENNLRAFSEVTISFRGRIPTLGWSSPWETHTVRSECGMTLSDGRGSDTIAGVGRGIQEPQAQLRAAPRVAERTSASGTPQSGGFVTEDILSIESVDYHLLATRELDGMDRLAIEETLAQITATGAVEGSNWRLFDAATAGEQVPVVEIELADGAVAQVRPVIDGVALPRPDLTAPPSTGPMTPTTVTDPEIPATQGARESPRPSAPVRPTSTSPEPSAPELPTTGGRDD